MLHSRLAALAFLAATLIASGCGESSKAKSIGNARPAATSSTANIPPVTSTTGTATTTVNVASGRPLTHGEWIAKADAICAHTNLVTESTKLKYPKDFARVLPQLALYHKTEAVELSKLVPPQDKAADWKKIIDGVNLVGAYVAQMAQYAQANNMSSAKPLLLRGNKVQERVSAIAKRNGFKECSKF